MPPEILNSPTLHRLRKDWPILAFLLMGTALRLVWPEDMEWKVDEISMFDRALEIVRTGQWPAVGLRSSIGLENPGLSMWIFAIIGYAASDPIGMVRGVQWLNVASLWGAYFFVVKAIPHDSRRPWLWGIALASVSPLSIVFSRKIWAQCVLPPFSLLLLVGHWYRSRRWGAWLWGFVGALLGQIHMSGFFFAGVLSLGTIWAEWRARTIFSMPRTRWGFWVVGSLVGSLGLLPWLAHLRSVPRDPVGWLTELATLKFFSQWWGAAFGINLKYSLTNAFWQEFLSEPIVSGQPTYLVALLHLFLVGCALFVIARWIGRKPSHGSSLETMFYTSTALWGAGLLMTLAGLRIYAHYMIVFFPLIHVWLADKLNRNHRLLVAVCLAQLVISSAFLNYIHREGGVPDGEYGPSFRAQATPSNRVIP